MKFIIDPNSNKKYNILSKKGIQLLRKYIQLYQHGSSKICIKNENNIFSDIAQYNFAFELPSSLTVTVDNEEFLYEYSENIKRKDNNMIGLYEHETKHKIIVELHMNPLMNNNSDDKLKIKTVESIPLSNGKKLHINLMTIDNKNNLLSDMAEYDFKFDLPKSLTVTVDNEEFLYEAVKELYNKRNNIIGLYGHEYGDNIILKLQLESSTDSDGSCGLIKSKTLEKLTFSNGKTVFINMMHSFTGDLQKMSKKYLSSEPKVNDIDIIKAYEEIRNMLLCLINKKQLIYTDLKLENIFVCFEEVNKQNSFSFYLGDIDSAVKLNESGVSTFPVPEYSADPGNIIIESIVEGKKYLSWQLGSIILQTCLYTFALSYDDFEKYIFRKIYWNYIQYNSVEDIYKKIDEIILFLKEKQVKMKNSQIESKGDKIRKNIIHLIEKTLKERVPIDKLPTNFSQIIHDSSKSTIEDID